MKKKKIILIAVLAMIMVASCFTFAACASPVTPKITYEVNWTFDDNITGIAVQGYDKIPDEFEEGTDVIFSVLAKEDYTVDDVTPHSAVEALEDGTFKFTVDGVLNVKISSKKQVNSYVISGVALEKSEDESKLYFVINGTYEGKPKYASLSDVHFITLDNCFLQTGTWWDGSRKGGGSATVTSFAEDKKSFDVKDDGTFTAKIDISELTVYWYATGIVLGDDPDLSDKDIEYYKPDWTNEAFDTFVTFDNKVFNLHFNPDSWDWMSNGIALIVKNAEA